MSQRSRFVQRLQTSNNARANFLWVLWLGTLAIKWITCPSGWDDAIQRDLILRNRDLWRNADLCNWCAPYWRYQDYCTTVMWFVVVGFFVAAGYWIIAHLDDVMHGARHLIQQAKTDQSTSPPATPPTTQPVPETSSRSSLPREIFVELIAEGVWDLLKRRNRP